MRDGMSTTMTEPQSQENTSDAQQVAGRRYAVITPCRNEAEYLPVTIETMAAQTVVPTLWLIVDDGSTDATPQLVEEASKKHPWIKLYKRADRGKRAVGGGVVQAFNEGLAQIDLDEFDYVCKLDADLGLPSLYFQRLIERMEQDPLLGNFSGKTYINPSGDGERWVSERMGDENAIGPTKFYRRECFQEIGGCVSQVCWDGIDMCRMKGWKALSLDEEEIRVRHYRPHGSSQQSIWVGRQRWGRGKYFMGSSLLFMLGVAGYRSIERPFLIGSLGLLVGYVRAWMSGHERMEDKEYLKYMRKYELRSLFFGKRRTMNRYHQQLESKNVG
jgi:biofilm PGA synthesis N-glycosyltransferase PgaC